MTEREPDETLSYRIRRNASGLLARMNATGAGRWYARRWAHSRPFRLANYALLAMALAYALVWGLVVRNLPSADKLVSYQPPLPTMVRGADGGIIYSYARERRVQLRYVDFPP
ncbi:MAG TPA: penicillin-binding protein, partial [Novosphingobium sp.]|nr:penicillin-binding protein [Novosphingobium sp.]